MKKLKRSTRLKARQRQSLAHRTVGTVPGDQYHTSRTPQLTLGHGQRAQGQLVQLRGPRLHNAQRHALAAQIGRAHGNRRLQQIIGTRGSVEGTGSWVSRAHPLAFAPQQATRILQRAPGRPLTHRQKLQKKYGITVEKGNKDWADAELKDLGWSLSKLSKPEATALKGYRFIRWSTPSAREKVDPTYKRSKRQEGGLHEAKFGTKNTSYFKISMYDEGFAKSTTIAKVRIGRYTLLHEIGHAIEVAGQRRTWEKFKQAETKYNSAVTKYNAQPSDLSQRKRRAALSRVSKLRTQLRKAEKKYDASVGRTLQAFTLLFKRKPIKTPYSGESMREAFADAFALNKIDPKGIRKANARLHRWFKRGSHLR